MIFLVREKDRIYPENWKQEINLYIIQDADKIKKRFRKLYDKHEPQVKEEVENFINRDQSAIDTHKKILEMIISPFLSIKKMNPFSTEFLFIDPLYFANLSGEIENLAIFDLLFVGIKDQKIKTIIFVEVKGGFPDFQISIEDLDRYENDDSNIQEKIFLYLFEQKMKKKGRELLEIAIQQLKPTKKQTKLKDFIPD